MEVANADIAGAIYLSIQVVSLVEMTTHLKFDLCFVNSHKIDFTYLKFIKPKLLEH